MRKEAEQWLKQAESDLKNANLLFENKAYDVAAFLSHQIAEKALKSKILKANKELPLKTHNLKELGEVANCPIDVMVALRDLTPHYIVSRYPDAANGVPAELYTENTAKKCMENAELVLKWCRK